jgi:hypothetical protein
MPQLVMSRRDFAEVPVALATATVPQPEPHQPRRIVALGWISRSGGQVVISARLDHAPATQAGR